MKRLDQSSRESRRSKPATRQNTDASHSFREEGVDPILTVSMVAEYLRCHPSTIYRLLASKKIPAFRLGSDWRFRKSAIEGWLKRATITVSG